MPSSPYLKVCLLLCASIAQYVGGRPPRPPPAFKVDIPRINFIDRSLRGVILHLVMRVWNFPSVIKIQLVPIQIFFQGLPIVVMWLDIVVVVLAYRGPELANHAILDPLCPKQQNAMIHTKLSMWTVTGAFMTCFGSLLRLYCYHELGDLFTVEVAIQPNHRLITSGPYAHVRHPSYTGAVLLLFGSFLVCVNPDSYLVRCNITSTYTFMGRILFGWGLWTAFFSYYLKIRAKVEDELLHARFGHEWDAYRQKVPSSFVSGVY